MSYSNYDFEDFNNFDEFEPFEQDASPIEDEENDDNYEDSEDETSPQSRRTSPTWKYFNEQTIQHPGYPVCCKCQCVFGKKTGISTLKRHLASIHKIKIGNVKNTGKNQSTLDFRRTDPWPEKEKNERDIAVVEWVIRDAQPFRSVENLRFKIMINKFDSQYQIPDEKTVKTLVVDYFKEKRKNIQEDLNAIPGKLSLTADMWTSTCNNDAFLGLTIHYIDNNWNLKNFLLDIISFTTRHTGNNIANAIKSVLTEFNLLEKTLALTTDNESAMVVCGRIIAEELTRELNDQSFRHYRCSAHILNLAAQQGIKIIDDEVVKIRELMKKIKHSTLRCDRLRELCSIENLTYYKPQLDVETRWNSTYYMIVKFQKMLRPIEMLAATDQDIKKFVPDAQGWIKINDTLTLLEPLEKATVLLSASSYPTISDYWEVVDSSTLASTVLDPRTKLTLFSTGEESTNAINAVKRRFSEYHTPMSQPAVINHDNGEVASTRDYFHQLKRRRLNNSTLNITRPSSGIYEEIDRYLALPCDDNVAPLLWWQAHFREFPALGAMA
ncbi:zinc finger BED domain-containing protein RICESLEEPER 2-like [Rhizophagus clarus]|uniref:Zinc finger BED domain-containing protein RICESLEEPER 2-like n=1 Tax=Rhizophagus clarus TaxID=94130 RepID=A0A8H3LG22_9GLOM|nr:zinc finger BED domain-containing protein RICESLEEPER 2-like [Rhizophagus clarus]